MCLFVCDNCFYILNFISCFLSQFIVFIKELDDNCFYILNFISFHVYIRIHCIIQELDYTRGK